MRRYLLDTHSLIWWHEDDERLSPEAKNKIEDRSNKLHVSIVSFWELIIKLTIGKIKLKYSIEELAKTCLDSDIEIVPVRFYHLNQLSLLPLFHRDPFDRMLVSVAYSDNMTLISKDNQLAAYKIKVFW